MAIQVGVGVSKETNSSQAGYKAVKEALQKCDGEQADFIIVFASSEFDQEALLQGVADAAGSTPMIGCTTAGEITGDGPTVGSVSVMAIATDTIMFHTGLGRDVQASSHAAGQAVAEEVQSKAAQAGVPLKTFIMLPDVLTGNGADAVRGVQSVLGEHFPVLGGAPGDDFNFQKTYEYRDGELASGAIAGVGLSGTFTMGAGVRHGWIPIGLPMKATKSDGAVLHELDGKPAINIYEEYFGDAANELRDEALARMAITYPLGIKLAGYEEEYLIRDPLTVDEQGSITCAAEIPEGSEVRLMIGSQEKAVEAAQEASKRMMESFTDGSQPKFILMFNCIAREKLFAQRANDEIQAVRDIVGKEVPILGFYTYGEQAPLGGELADTEKISSRFYNETIVMLAIGE